MSGSELGVGSKRGGGRYCADGWIPFESLGRGCSIAFLGACIVLKGFHCTDHIEVQRLYTF